MAVELLIADAEDLVLGSLLVPPWGVYLNGVPVIQPATQFGQTVGAALAPIQLIAGLLGAGNILPVTASTVEFEFSQDWPISDYPQEQGAFQSYNKVTLPFDVKLKLACGGSTSNRQAFLTTCLAVANSFALFDVVTPEITFTSVNCSHINWPRRAKQGATLIVVDLYFRQINVTGQVGFSSTQQPGESGTQALGNVQPQSPPLNILQGFSTGGLSVQ